MSSSNKKKRSTKRTTSLSSPGARRSTSTRSSTQSTSTSNSGKKNNSSSSLSTPPNTRQRTPTRSNSRSLADDIKQKLAQDIENNGGIHHVNVAELLDSSSDYSGTNRTKARSLIYVWKGYPLQEYIDLLTELGVTLGGNASYRTPQDVLSSSSNEEGDSLSPPSTNSSTDPGMIFELHQEAATTASLLGASHSAAHQLPLLKNH